MKKITLLLALAVGVGALAPSSRAGVIGFEGLATNTDQIIDIGPTYTEAGYLFTNTSPYFSPSFAVVGVFSPFYSGSTALMDDSFGTTILTQSGGGAFAFTSIDLSELIPTGDSNTVTFTGTLPDNSTITQTVTMNGQSGVQTFPLNSFGDVVSVSWDQNPNPYQFDNAAVDLAVIPEPSTGLLVVAGMLATMIRHRKQAAS